jgi:hypothetical protein
MSKDPLSRRSRALPWLLICGFFSFFIVLVFLSGPETRETSLWPLAIVPLLLFLGGAYSVRRLDRVAQRARVGFGLTLVMGLLLELFAFRVARGSALAILFVGAAWALAGAAGAWFLRRDVRAVGVGALQFAMLGAVAGALPRLAGWLVERGVYPAFLLIPLAFVLAPVIGGLVLARTLRSPTWAGQTPSS